MLISRSPKGDPVWMSSRTRAIWPLASSSVCDALQLQCDHHRVYMATFNAATECHLSHQCLHKWQSTLIGNDNVDFTCGANTLFMMLT